MPAKKSAPKPSRSKKAPSRPAARKAVTRKPVERAKVATHTRNKTAVVPTRKAPPPPSPTVQNSTETTDLMRKAV